MKRLFFIVVVICLFSAITSISVAKVASKGEKKSSGVSGEEEMEQEYVYDQYGREVEKTETVTSDASPDLVTTRETYRANKKKAAEKSAIITSIEGPVELDLQGAGKWIPATKGMRLKKGSKLRTGNKSRVYLSFDEKKLNILRIGGNSDITIDKISDKASKVTLRQGKVLVSFEDLKSGSEFEVETSSGICGIREIKDSAMGVEVTGNDTHVLAFKGKVFGHAQAYNPDKAPPRLKVGDNPVFDYIEDPSDKERSNWYDSLPPAPIPSPAPPEKPDERKWWTEEVDGKDLDDIKKEESLPDISPSS